MLMKNKKFKTYQISLKSLLLLFCILLSFLSPVLALGQQAPDPWMEEMEKAKGLTVGDLKPRFGNLPPTREIEKSTGTGRDDETSEDTDKPGNTSDAERAGSIDPNTLDPTDPNVANYIKQWTSTAKPPQNAVPGSNWRYDPFGRVVGRGPGLRTTSTHDSVDYGGGTPEASAWFLRKKLDSIDHCTLEEYVVKRLKNESIDHCLGRYGAVKKLKGMSLPDAKAAVTTAGFKYDNPVPGTPAETPEATGTIERQEPVPEQYLKKGQVLSLVVHTPYVPTREEQVANTDCSRYPGSRAYWDDTEGKPMCGCPQGYTWAADRTHCEKLIPPDELCARNYPGSVPTGRDTSGKVNCDCPQGYVWNSNRTQCVQGASPEELCARDYPGSVVRGRTSDGKVNCECPEGYTWSADRTHCEKLIPPDELCARNYPGSVPTGRDTSGKVNCDCPQGYVWNSNRTQCVQGASPEELCARDYPGSVVRGRTSDGKVNCECPEGYTWSADRTHCEKLIPPDELCARNYPGSVPTGRDTSGKVNCDCPQGYTWADNPRRCVRTPVGGGGDRNQQCSHLISQIKGIMDVYRRDPRNNSHLKGIAEGDAQQARMLGCNQNQINQALGTGGGDGDGGNGDGRRSVCPPGYYLGSDGTCAKIGSGVFGQ